MQSSTPVLQQIQTVKPDVSPYPTHLPVYETPPAPGINPLTGLPPENVALLERRPVIVKVENLPRNNRPQFGLSKADIVYEYHTEEGTTRYAAVFYGQNTERVGPIRSGRWFDINLIQMYKSIFIFGSAYEELLKTLLNADFGDRLILEGPMTAAVLQRYDPNGKNLLLANLNNLPQIIAAYKIDNTRQSLNGMYFDAALPQDGKPAKQLFVRYSGAIYNHWDYDSTRGVYDRFVDADDDINRDQPVYEQMLDQQSGQPISADNVVMIMARNFVVSKGIYNIDLIGSQPAYLARDGKIFEVKWLRQSEKEVLTLVDNQGNPVPFKPGNTWFEVLSLPPEVQQQEDNWHFNFTLPES